MIRKIVFIIYLSFSTILLSQTFSDLMSDIQEQTPLWTGSFGTVTIDGVTYNQVSLRPEFNLGKWGVGFDFYLYIDGEGNIYEESWDFSDWNSAYQTMIDKLKYIRYGYPGDQFYFKVGSISGISLGHGIMVDEYSNMIRYPEVRKVGLQVSKYFSSGIGLEFVQSDFKQFPSLMGVRVNYPIMANFDFGVSVAIDVNQNAGLDDSDDDDVPDFIDLFPDNGLWWNDTDGDGLADEDTINEHDIDGDGWDVYDFDGDNDIDADDVAILQDFLDMHNQIYTDTVMVVDTSPDWVIEEDKDITFTELSESITGIAADFTYHINENFKLYSEFSILSSGKTYDLPNGQGTFRPGYGLIPFGLKGHYGPFSFKVEYRKNSDYFMYNFWNRSYDISRSMVDGTNVVSKASQLYRYGAMQGIYLSAGGSVLNIVTLGLGYQDLSGKVWNDTLQDFEDSNNRSFVSTISLNTTSIPKVKYVNAFYQNTNVKNPFDIVNPSENTVYGYDLGVDFSESMVLVYKSRTSYEPDGQGDFKKIYTMFVETQILF